MRTYITLFVLVFLIGNFITNSTSFATSFNLNTKTNSLSRAAPQLNRSVLKLALAAYKKAQITGIAKKPLLAVIDYSLPSSKQRLWIFDLHRNRLLYNTYVAHGVNSGDTTPHHFSNQASSKASSLGAYVTQSTYSGSNGLSLNLKGLEKGFNDNAYDRRVVMHGAWYVDPNFIRKSISFTGKGSDEPFDVSITPIQKKECPDGREVAMRLLHLFKLLLCLRSGPRRRYAVAVMRPIRHGFNISALAP